MVYIGTDTYGPGSATSGTAEQTVSVPGLVAAGSWALGLVVGLVALATGHQLLAVVVLALAVASPWVGLAWVSHSQRREAHARLMNRHEIAPCAGGWPAL